MPLPPPRGANTTAVVRALVTLVIVPLATTWSWRLQPDAAERHVTTAISLRRDPGSQLSCQDRALLGLTCARRASPRR